MKTIHIIYQIAIVTCLSTISMAATGQQNTRQDRRSGSERNTYRTETSQRSRGHSEGRVSDNDSRQRGSERYKRKDSGYERNERSYKKEDRQQGYYKKSKQGHRPAPAHVYHSAPRPGNNRVAHVRHLPHRHDTYFRHLPTKRVNRFHHNGYDYYHSNNRFYRYYPRYGYRMVEAPFTHVRYLPARYQVRVYNGYSYPYYNGYFFLPAEYGYVMVPAPARPRMSFNVVLNF
ncbi:hypothetical protein [Geofilum rubicundum]|uniref:Uncharacterized protein n=1 Tax=Geofilum rubicundum JCM 15548 TaxID=1236989 RepID=A0A0E9LWK7_9BACT|nr:hypothetical protein [Geofilum rubicundum]GAO29260.1 hypothetical protein JCM15548_11428 [Geofilum rubicundum JCM 15548]